MIEEAIEFAHRFFDLYLCAGKQVGGLVEGASTVVDAGQTVKADGQCVQHVAGIALAALLYNLTANGEQGFCVGQVFVLQLQLVEFVFAKCQVF